VCCFSRKVESVTNTNIFARRAAPGRQYVVYSMTLSTGEELAMILPLPVLAGSGEHAVRFINLKKYPDFFDDLRKGFPESPATRKNTFGGFGAVGAAETLKVVEVGSFEASFVPTVRDFARLDERFRLPEGTWDKLPAYRKYGFAVFKLKQGAKTIHPMALEFFTAQRQALFFPTVHIHDGQVHPQAEFDHTLYCQVDQPHRGLMRWRESPQPTGMFMDVNRSQGLVAAAAHCYRFRIEGRYRNQDVIV
jgi:hypothetical protein